MHKNNELITGSLKASEKEMQRCQWLVLFLVQAEKVAESKSFKSGMLPAIQLFYVS
jgi:hypothetical protein